jgi:hypothetical protein
MRFGSIHYFFDKQEEHWKFVFSFDNDEYEYIEPWWKDSPYDYDIITDAKGNITEAWLSFHHSRQDDKDESFELMTTEAALWQLKELIDEHLGKLAYIHQQDINALRLQCARMWEMKPIYKDQL